MVNFPDLNNEAERFRIGASLQAAAVGAGLLYAGTPKWDNTFPTNYRASYASKKTHVPIHLEGRVGEASNPGPRGKKIAKIQSEIASLKSKTSKGSGRKGGGARSSRSSGKQGVLTEGNNAPRVDQLGTVPSALFGARPTAYRETRRIVRRFGRNGIEIHGCQRVADVVATITTGANKFANVAAGGVITNSVTIFDTPEHLGGPLDLQSNAHQQYLITRQRFVYCPTISTGTTGNVVMGYSTDPKTSSSSVANITTLEDSVDIAPYASWSLNVSQLDTSRLYDVTVITTSGTDQRMSIQGVIILGGTGAPAPAADTTLGVLYMEYVCEMYGLAASSSLNYGLNHRLMKPLREFLPPSLADGMFASSSACKISVQRDPDKDEEKYFIDVRIPVVRRPLLLCVENPPVVAIDQSTVPSL